MESSEFHHVAKIPYTSEHVYNPDFSFSYKGKVFHLEAKGYFQDSNELQKYPWIKKSLKDNEELIFVFEDHKKPIHFRAKRQDGTRLTHGEWCEKNGFRYVTADTMEVLFD